MGLDDRWTEGSCTYKFRIRAQMAVLATLAVNISGLLLKRPRSTSFVSFDIPFHRQESNYAHPFLTPTTSLRDNTVLIYSTNEPHRFQATNIMFSRILLSRKRQRERA